MILSRAQERPCSRPLLRILVQCKRYKKGKNDSSDAVIHANGARWDLHRCHRAVIVELGVVPAREVTVRSTRIGRVGVRGEFGDMG
ncbi:hypothetical protein ACFQ7F_18825 [Streptomyces sp. NPDC056486]|uniref:hypothetical protein n=1 Tax=Streptomyces sp. NPDC056486 TaxID=3345835 RepID=UPI0036B425B0